MGKSSLCLKWYNLSMTDTELQTWQQLHNRRTQGKTLSTEEEAFYHRVVAVWDAQEDSVNQQMLQKTRARLQSLEAEHDQLMTKHQQLAKQIRAIEEAIVAQQTVSAT